MKDSGKEIPSGLLVGSVQIHSSQRRTRVTNNYTIRIQHGYQFEHKMTPQYLIVNQCACVRLRIGIMYLGMSSVRCEPIDKPLHHPAAVSFSRVNSSTHQHTSSARHIRHIYN